MTAPIGSLEYDDWLRIVWSSPWLLLRASEVLWPQFVDVDGYLHVMPGGQWESEEEFLQHIRDSRDRLGWARLNVVQRREATASIAEVDIGLNYGRGLLAGESDDDVDRQVSMLAERCGEMWLAAVRLRYPDRSFELHVEAEDHEGFGPLVRILETTAELHEVKSARGDVEFAGE